MPIDLAIPFTFYPVLSGDTVQDPGNPNAYYADEPTWETIAAGDFIGDVSRGGSVNYRKVTLTPHGNGTHTECYGHISAVPEATLDRCFTPRLLRARLVTVRPWPPMPPFEGECVTLDALLAAWPGPFSGYEVLVIRTLPNGEYKKAKRYSGTDPAYLDVAISHWLVERGIEHIVVDLPSVDPERDGGALRFHNTFWGVDAGGKAARPYATITELAYIPDEAADGPYYLDLGVPAWRQEAAPSRPVLYTPEELKQLTQPTWTG